MQKKKSAGSSVPVTDNRKPSEPLRDPADPMYIVTVGASAGGLDHRLP